MHRCENVNKSNNVFSTYISARIIIKNQQLTYF